MYRYQIEAFRDGVVTGGNTEGSLLRRSRPCSSSMTSALHQECFPASH